MLRMPLACVLVYIYFISDADGVVMGFCQDKLIIEADMDSFINELGQEC